MIRPERPGDGDAIHAVHAAAFGREDEARIADEVRAGEGSLAALSLVATAGDEVVGHVLLSWAGLEGSPRRLLLLGPIGVLPALQGQGIGSALVRAALDGARALGEPLVVLEGSPAYYGRFGFVRADALGVLPPPGTPDWAFQAAILDETADLPHGRIVYPSPFAA